ncbi:nuclear pore membrane glycoprotein 210-like [Mixophyes fleayi]|uniref:nuclear pore membrane glycoprotein 210-like n=1 Tax=Mixophyes fleayi TaxID=3061075 RepID=UPI003F4DFD15
MRILTFLSLLPIFLEVSTEASRLSVPKVLLPFHQGSEVSFTLEADGECYMWSVSHPDIISVTPVYNNGLLCSQKAILSSRSEQAKRLTSVVTAEETVTGEVLHCDVIVDVIATMEIVSRTHELYVDDAPVELNVIALDNEGNTFSTLAGINFQWTVMMDETEGILEPPRRIRILKYTETQYYIPDYIALMEKAGKQGDIILVSGVSTGVSVVKMRIESEFYKHIPIASKSLLVLEKISVSPCCEVLLLIHAYVQFQVKRMVKGKHTGAQGLVRGAGSRENIQSFSTFRTLVYFCFVPTEMVPPLANYIVQLADQVVAPGGHPSMPVADLDEKTLIVTAMQLGCASLIFVHKNIHMHEGSRLPKSTVCAVEPGYLRFSIRPGDLWVLEVERMYEVSIDVYDKTSIQRVYPSHNLRIQVHFPSEFFSFLFSSENGSYHILHVNHIGTTTIRATLLSVLTVSLLWMFSDPLTQDQEVKIFLPITLSPQILAFPNYPKDASYRYTVQVEGGSGNFSWLSTNKSIASVTASGIVITERQPGHCLIQANDLMNPLHQGESKVLVISVISLELLLSNADTQVGQEIHVPVVVYGNYLRSSVPLINCSLLALQISTDRAGVFNVLEDRCTFSPPSCSCVKLLAQNPGQVKLKVGVTTDDGEYYNESMFSAYSPLKVPLLPQSIPLKDRDFNCNCRQCERHNAVDPVQTALLSLYSTKEMVFEGGPRPWLLDPTRFFIELKAQDWNSIHAHRVQIPSKTKQNLYTYWVQCTKLGEQVLTLKLGNKPGLLNPKPSVEKVEVGIICANPANMFLYPVYPVSAGVQPCPIPHHDKQLMTVSMLRDTTLELIVYDQHRRKFDNFSSLLIEWTSSDESMAHLSHNEDMQMVSKGDGSGQTWLHGQHLLEVKQVKGTVFISVNCAGYRPWVEEQDPSLLPISNKLGLSLVDDVSVLPNVSTIFDHPDVKEILSIVEGSGYFLVNISDLSIVNITHEEGESTAQVTPVNPGSLMLEVFDLCISSAKHMAAIIHISDIRELEIDMVDKVEVGKSVVVFVKVQDSFQRPFLNKYFGIMQLTVQSSSPIVSLKQLHNSDKFSWNYLLHGIDVGQTTLIVTAYDKTRRKLTSAPRPVEVFAPFRMVPDTMTLIPRNMIQVMSEGGPQPQSAIQFSICNTSVATVNDVGQVTGVAVGTTKVTGVVQALNKDTGNALVFSQAELLVEVIELKAIRIHAPVTRLITGSEMPVYVMGISSNQTPFSFSNSQPPLQFCWSLNKRDVVTLEPRMSEAPQQLRPELNFAQLVRTRAPGRISLKVTVRSVSIGQFEGNTTELKDQIQIVVIRCLSLASPECSTQQILMAPNSHLTVTTNKEGEAAVTSRILQCFPNSSVIEDDRKGHLKAGGVTGFSILQITAIEPFGVTQSLVTGLQVAPVSYFRIEVKPKLHTKSGLPLASFPLGITLRLTVYFYSNIGERFHAQTTQLGLAINRDDLLLIEPDINNYTFLVTTVTHGVTLLRMWDKAHPGMADFVPISVEDAIYPQLTQPYRVGEVVCFNTELVNSNNEPGIWQVSPGQFLQLDGVTGVAVARSKGITNVFYMITGLLTTYKQVTIIPSESLILSAMPQRHLTNFPGRLEYTILVSTSSTEPVLKGPCSDAQVEVIKDILTPADHLLCSVHFTNKSLQISATKLFQTRPAFSTESGQYVCVISIRPLPDVELQAMSTVETVVEMKASLVDGGSGVLHVPFYPAFHLNQSKLVFSSHKVVGYIRLYGISAVIQKIEIVPSFPDVSLGKAIVSVKRPGLVLFPVSILNFRSIQMSAVPLFINLSCDLTGQNMALPVKAAVEDEDEETGLISQLIDSFHVILFTVFAVLASTSAMFIAYNWLVSQLQRTPIVYLSTSQRYSPDRGPADNQRRRPSPRGWLWSIRY